MRGRHLLLLAVLLIAVNARASLAAVSPVLPELRSDLGLAAGAAGLLTTLPLLCFALAAPLAAWFGRRVGTDRAILVALLGIALGTVVRVVDGSPVLLLGTLLLGLAMTIANVLVPVVVKRDFGRRAGTVTGLYTAAMATGPALTAALTAPMAAVTGWRMALASWATLAVAGAAVWQVSAWRDRRRRDAGTLDPATGADAVAIRGPNVWRSRLAWALGLFLAFQAASYHAMSTWIPTQLVDDAALDLATAGLAMSLFQLLGIPGTLIIPAVAMRRRSQSWIGPPLALAWLTMMLGLLLRPEAWPVWMVLGGLSQGAGISLVFTLLVLRSADAQVARSLSGMVQLVGYGLGAAGPVVVGVLYEATGGWTASLLLLAVCALGVGVMVTAAGRDTVIGGREAAGAERPTD